LLASKHVPTVLAELERRHDLVVIDTSAVGTFSDALILARHASATILVVEAGRTTVADVRQTIEVLRNVGAHVIGVVLNQGRVELAAGTTAAAGTATTVSPSAAPPWVPLARGFP
jgi:Mrp family chromosome partitioning ATPase